MGRGDFLIGGHQFRDESGNYTGGMSLAEMKAYTSGSVGPTEVAVQSEVEILPIEAQTQAGTEQA